MKKSQFVINTVFSFCYLLVRYGGSFATISAFTADSFGPANIGKVYGFMLTAWSDAGMAPSCLKPSNPRRSILRPVCTFLLTFPS